MAKILAGAEIRVNSVTTGNQSSPQIKALEGGGWVVTWTSAELGSSERDIYQQRYTASGTKAGGESLVNTRTVDDQYNPQITVLKDGGWVVTWSSYRQDGSRYGIYQQAYTASGAKAGGEVRVNSYTTLDQIQPVVVALDGGGWVVTWHSENQDGSNLGVYQQAYAADGTRSGTETRVNTHTPDAQFAQKITALKGGGWVVTWQSYLQDGDHYGVYQQIYNASGLTVGPEMRVNTYVTSSQMAPQITSIEDGGWVVTWQSYGQDGSGYGVYQQVYDASGTKRGGETQVNNVTISNQYKQTVTALKGGGWVVTWQSTGQDGSDEGVYSQAYAANGNRVGAETRVNSFTADQQHYQQITSLANGGWVVTWQSYGQDGSSYGVYQQAFRANGTKDGAETRVNSFTAGDQAAPQITALKDGGWVVTWHSSAQDGSGYGVYQKVFHFNKAPIDVIRGNGKNNTLTGTKGPDDIRGLGGNDKLYGLGGNDKLYGGAGKDQLFGGAGNDRLEGGKGADKLVGGKGADTLIGGAGADTLVGGKGGDKLTGAKGADIFVFNSVKDSTVKKGGRDVITDFNRKQGDKIDLKKIDAKAGTKKNDEFDFIGKKAFSGEKGELRYEKKGGKTFVYGDVNGDRKADFAIELSKALDLKKVDFIL